MSAYLVRSEPFPHRDVSDALCPNRAKFADYSRESVHRADEGRWQHPTSCVLFWRKTSIHCLVMEQGTGNLTFARCVNVARISEPLEQCQGLLKEMAWVLPGGILIYTEHVEILY